MEERKPRSLHLRNMLCLAAALLIPPVGIAVALRVDGEPAGTLSDLGLWALPLLGLLILLPQVNGWLARLLIAIVYVGAELFAMFVVGVMLACAWYRACL